MTRTIYFITYDKNTKRLTSRGKCSKVDLDSRAGKNEVSIEYEAETTEAYYDEVKHVVVYD